MKWPKELTIVRHGESTYNKLKAKKERNPFYQKFVIRYEEIQDWGAPLPNDIIEMAEEITREFSLGMSDFHTPMTKDGREQAFITGQMLEHEILLPDVIFVSPFMRTAETLREMIIGWPELAEVKTYSEERIREKSPGLAALYNDWRVFNVLYPEQKRYRDLFGELVDYWYRYPNGENIPDARELLGSWVTTLIREFSGKRVLAVSHHLTILAMRAHLERLGTEEFIELDKDEKPINCGVTIYRGDPKQGKDGKFILARYNEKLY